MRFHRIAAVVATAVAAAAMIGGCSANTGPASSTTSAKADLPDPIVLATSALKAPASFEEEGTGKIVGLEPDIAAGIAKALGVKLEITKSEFDALIPGLQSGRADLAASNLNATAEREKAVDIVAYMTSWSSFLVPAADVGKYKEVTDFCGKKIALLTGAPQQQYVETDLVNACKEAGLAAPVPLATSDAAALTVAIKSGQADGMLQSTTTAHANAAANPSVFGVPDSIKVLPGYVGFLFPKKSALTEPFRDALQGMLKDGSYEKLMEKWKVTGFALDPSQPVPLNPSTK